jgi:16S rRNA (uracil1498-N3)-methyltransferase
MRAGDPLILFDGSGHDYHGTIKEISKKKVTVELDKVRLSHTESPLRITLWHSICRGGRMDYVVQKATELGVHAIQPVFTTRGIVRLDKPRTQKKIRHWQKIAISAAEQSGRSRLPDIREPRPLTESLATVQPEGQHLMLDPDGTTGFGNLLTANQEITLFSGPEGGFTQEECAEAQAAGFRLVSLGPRILRTETAPVVALGIVQNIAGDLGATPAEEDKRKN